MSIDEGDTVVTPSGEITKIIYQKAGAVYTLEGNHYTRFTDKPERLCEYYDLIKANAPLQIRVDSEDEAEFLIARAEEAGFEFPKFYGFSYSGGFTLHPPYEGRGQNKVITWVDYEETGYDLTFADYDQWNAWLDYHAEDDCTDSDEYDETPPGKRPDMSKLNEGEKNYIKHLEENIDRQVEKIRSLNDEIEDVKEERDELWETIHVNS